MTHADIIARLTAATGPDEELAVDIYETLGICSYIPDEGDPTASLDACLALIERVLPGWDYAIGTTRGKGCAGLHKIGADDDGVFVDDRPTPPLAALLALSRVLEAQEAV